MIAQVEYIFERLPTKKTRFRLVHEHGSGIHNFPSRWIAINHSNLGDKYIVYHEMYGKQNCSPSDGSAYALYFGTDRPKHERLISGLKFIPEFPNQAYGVYKDEALLIQLSEDKNKMTIWVFKGKGETSYSLFKEWVYGALTLTVETDDLPLPMSA